MRFPLRLASALVLASMLASPASAMECTTLGTGERICQDGDTILYGEAGSQELMPVTEEMTLGLLLLLGGALAGLADGVGADLSGDSAEADGTIYGGDGGSISSRGGCTMYSSPGYSFGESFSFSSGC